MQLLHELRERPGGACWQGNAILREYLKREERCKTGHGHRGSCAEGKMKGSTLRRSESTSTGLAVCILRRPSTSSMAGFVTRGGSESPSNSAFLQISGKPPLAQRSVPNSPKQPSCRPASRMPHGVVARSGSARLPAVRVGGNALRRSYAEAHGNLGLAAPLITWRSQLEGGLNCSAASAQRSSARPSPTCSGMLNIVGQHQSLRQSASAPVI